MATNQPPSGNLRGQNAQRWAVLAAAYIEAFKERGATFYEVSRCYGRDNKADPREFLNSISPRWPLLNRNNWAVRLAKPNGGVLCRKSNQGRFCFLHFAPRYAASIQRMYGPLLQALALVEEFKRQEKAATSAAERALARENRREAERTVEKHHELLMRRGVLFVGELLR